MSPNISNLEKLANIDVVMCTYNNNKSWFNDCLESIKRGVLVHCFILVDFYSKDSTVLTVKQYFPNAKIIKTKDKLARARRTGFEQVDTPWFAFF
jgi:glycosyltransferase involved in cell wall biosynthesis